MNTKSGMRVRRLLLQFGGYALVFLFGAACMFFTMKSGFPGGKEQPTQPTSGFARSESCIPTTQPHVEPVQVQMASLCSTIDTVESSGTTGHTPKYTYEEIVTDPEFLTYTPDIQFCILFKLFEDRGYDTGIFGTLALHGSDTKYYSYERGIDNDPYFYANLLVRNALSSEVSRALSEDKEFQLIFLQFCKFCMPYIKDYYSDKLSLHVYRGAKGISADDYFTVLSCDFIEMMANKCEVDCGTTGLKMANSSPFPRIDYTDFHIVFKEKD